MKELKSRRVESEEGKRGEGRKGVRGMKKQIQKKGEK